jgi:hypothetical protein
MHLNTTLQNPRDLYVARRNPMAARWTTHCGLMPRTSGTNAPGDGVSDREKDAGNWGSTANDGSVPDPDTTERRDRPSRTQRDEQHEKPTPGTNVNADNENLAEDTPLVGDREGGQVMRGPHTPTPAPGR